MYIVDAHVGRPTYLAYLAMVYLIVLPTWPNTDTRMGLDTRLSVGSRLDRRSGGPVRDMKQARGSTVIKSTNRYCRCIGRKAMGNEGEHARYTKVHEGEGSVRLRTCQSVRLVPTQYSDTTQVNWMAE